MAAVRLPFLAFASALTLAACATPGAREAESDSRAALMSDYLQGRYADLTNAPDVAAENYLNALRQAPGDSVLAEGAVSSALVAGDIERAGQAASLAKNVSAANGLGRLTLATLALRDGRYDAVRALAPASEGPPVDRLAARLLRAWSLAGEGKTEQALATATDPNEGAPFTQLFDYQRAMILQRAGKNDEAIKTYNAAIDGGLRTPAAIVQYGALLQRLGRKAEAIALYKKMLADGDEPLASAALASAMAGGPAPASRLDRPSEGAAIGMLSLAALLLGQTDADFYLPYLTLALALDPTLDGARLVYAEGLQELKQWSASAAALDMIAPSSPFYERALVQRVFLLRQEGDESGALTLAHAAANQTHGKLARLALADLLRDADKWAEAEPIYDSLIREGTDDTPQAWRLYFARGACRERLHDWPAAEADLQKALALAPDQAEVLNYLGYSWIEQGINLKDGLKLIAHAVQLEPDAGYIVDSLGWAYFKLGEYRTAVEHLERAVELSPEDPILNDHLGDAYWRTGRKAEARFQWTRALSLKPAAQDAPRIQEKLAKGLPPERVRRVADGKR